MSATHEITPTVPAARYHFRELAHAEALMEKLPVPPWWAEESPATKAMRDARHQAAQWRDAEATSVREMLCAKCEGRGITQWRHRCGGVCFQCNGYGWSAKGRRKYTKATS